MTPFLTAPPLTLNALGRHITSSSGEESDSLFLFLLIRIALRSFNWILNQKCYRPTVSVPLVLSIRVIVNEQTNIITLIIIHKLFLFVYTLKTFARWLHVYRAVEISLNY